MRRPIMVVGLGDLGRHVLELLARLPNVPELVAVDVNEEGGRKRANAAIAGAAFYGLYPCITFEPLDVTNIDRTASLVARVNPEVVFHATTLQSYWVVGLLPKELNRLVYPGLGPWLPMHLALGYAFMQGVKAAGVDTRVVNGSFPDAVNVILARRGLGPAAGIGNVDCVVQLIRRTVAILRGVEMRHVDVAMVGHHYHSYNIGRHGVIDRRAPFYLRIAVHGEEVTRDYDSHKLFAEVPRLAGRSTGREGHFVIASSALKTMMGIYNDSGEVTHSPGAEGLPGAYPVRLSRDGARLCLPADLARDTAVALMEEAQRHDCIERIEPDGTAIITTEADDAMAAAIGYRGSRVTPESALDQAREMGRKFSEFLSKHHVTL